MFNLYLTLVKYTFLIPFMIQMESLDDAKYIRREFSQLNTYVYIYVYLCVYVNSLKQIIICLCLYIWINFFGSTIDRHL